MPKIIYIFITTLLLYACKEAKNDVVKSNFTIKIKLIDAKDDSKIYLKKQKDNLNLILDSTYIKNEIATFSGNINIPEVYGVFFENYTQGIFPIIEEGNIIIDADINNLKSVKIFGTPLNDQLNEYKENAKRISSKMNDLFHDFQKARAENNAKKISGINQKMNLINHQLTNYKTNFIIQNPNSFVSSMILYSIVNEKSVANSKIENLYNSLSNEVKESEFSKNAKVLIDLNKVSGDTLK